MANRKRRKITNHEPQKAEIQCVGSNPTRCHELVVIFRYERDMRANKTSICLNRLGRSAITKRSKGKRKRRENSEKRGKCERRGIAIKRKAHSTMGD